jgi:membrane protein DedA with SNARE-associated domain
MEPEVRAFLLRVLYTITAGLIWMILNVWAGIYMGWLFFEGSMKTGNVIFYSFMVISLGVLIWYYVRLWQVKPEEENKL